ncbi:MAG: serine hydrolase domain-containing protein [Chloroflexota bacterium]
MSDLSEQGRFTGSVLVAHNGEVLLSEGYGFSNTEEEILNTAQTKFRLASLTKQFTAAAILILQEQGKLDVQDSICDYLTECSPVWESITIHQLLIHTSGIPNYTDIPEFWPTIATPAAPAETLNLVYERDLDFPSGEEWGYSNSGYLLLGLIIEEIAQQPYDVFLEENIFAPLNMTNSGYDHNLSKVAKGYVGAREADFVHMSLPYAAGGLYSSVEDMFKWDQALHNGELINNDSLSEMFSPHVFAWGGRSASAGYGWLISEENGRLMYQHDGGIPGFVTTIAHYPDEDLLIVILSNQERSHIDVAHTELANLIFE